MKTQELDYKVFEKKTMELIGREFGQNCKFDPRIIESQIHTELLKFVMDSITTDQNDPRKAFRIYQEYTDEFFEEHYNKKGVGSR